MAAVISTIHLMLTCELEDGSNKHYILQRMNDDIFPELKELMEML